MEPKLNQRLSELLLVIYMNQDLKIWIKNNILDKNLNPIGLRFSSFLKKNEENCLILMLKTNYLDNNCKISERIYNIINDITSVSKCKNKKCFNKVKFINYKQGYNDYCSWKCSNTCSIAKQKYIETCMKKYGVNHPWKNNKIKLKRKKTNIKKYGFDNPSKSKEIKDKIKKNTLEKYGNENYFYSLLPKDNFEKLNNKNFLYKEYIINKKTSRKISNQLNVSKSALLKNIHKQNIPINYEYFVSFAEREIIDFINQKNIQTNTRKIISPYELDIFILENKLAIEFDGLYWHSEEYKDKKYHLLKTKMCEEKDIQLLHIFENEWLNESIQDIWKSIINSKLGKNKKIFARNCKVKEITDNKIIHDFLDKNHLQGFVGSNIKIGLFYKNQLISLMTFGKSRYSNKFQYEMIRFCSKKYLNVVGGASKLFKYFIRNYDPQSVISYADKRYSDGNLYKILGFEYSHSSAPNYFYYKLGTNVLYPRIKFQKHKLEKQLEIYNPKLSEAKNMFNNNYRRIWDCGNMIYVYNNK